MPRIQYAPAAQFAELMHRSGLPENTPATNAFRMLAHTPAVSTSVLRVILALLTESDLDPGLRELVILRVAQRYGGRYAWVQHVDIAATVGVNNAQIEALEQGQTPASLFSDRERTAFAFADEVLDTCRAEDDTFAAVRDMFSTGEVLELLLLIGYFRMICAVMTTLHVPLEPAFGTKILDMIRETARPRA
jgi:4-carboxymuconolactone decarboxylase